MRKKSEAACKELESSLRQHDLDAGSKIAEFEAKFAESTRSAGESYTKLKSDLGQKNSSLEEELQILKCW